MKNTGLLAVIFMLTACQKPALTATGTTESFVRYTIRSGQQYCEQTVLKQVQLSSMKFMVKFDSTAIYSNSESHDLGDINKLYGFSDNGGNHHEYSARFGWRWNDGKLRLFGYTYNTSARASHEICSIEIGKVYTCAIKVEGNKYIFSVDQLSHPMSRLSPTPMATGYKLFPYYGGDLVAPHDIHIWIRDLP